ncbi:uncharacterized protein F4822DRAFT_51608 [Hypoxylon trugodes]|uniref:uncharacterized protein n=1 Tax=Hypoxylon trugodes TaxID=326681 RepID=UPI00218EF700|nr:uncharacterized protein F4822DRAFT_51608 [Hypoxylon trugodes]KAI1383792.1 hypothetical protein F4822DRAFT_51608 [Hypoxylon trugodes]
MIFFFSLIILLSLSLCSLPVRRSHKRRSIRTILGVTCIDDHLIYQNIDPTRLLSTNVPGKSIPNDKVTGMDPSLDAGFIESLRLRHQRINRSSLHVQPLRILMLLGCFLLHAIPAASLVVPSTLRIASGVGSSASAIAVVPLRTLEGVSSTAWIVTYAVWLICFLIYILLQLRLLPGGRGDRKNLSVRFQIRTCLLADNFLGIFSPLF